MQNLLVFPKGIKKIEEETWERKKEKEKWDFIPASELNPNFANSLCIDLKDEPITNTVRRNMLPLPEPNERFVDRFYMHNADTPLNRESRGVTAEPFVCDKSLRLVKTVSFQQKLKNKMTRRAITEQSFADCLYINVLNDSKHPFDVYIIRDVCIRHTSLPPSSQMFRSIEGANINLSGYHQKSPDSGYQTPQDMGTFLFTRTAHSCVYITNFQEVKDYLFDSAEPVGIEIEYRGIYKLYCSKVIENSQAWKYRDELDGAEVISINGERTFNLQDFVRLVKYCRKLKMDIVMKADQEAAVGTLVEDIYALWTDSRTSMEYSLVGNPKSNGMIPRSVMSVNEQVQVAEKYQG